MASPYRISEETLGMSSVQRGLPAMVSQVQPGPNMFDGGAVSKPSVNAQPSNNERYKLQEISRNIESAAPQAAAEASNQVGRQIDQSADAENKAQQFAATRMSEVLYANDSGAALMKLNSVMQSPEKAKYMQDIATGKALAAGMNPDLGSEVVDKNRYGI